MVKQQPHESEVQMDCDQCFKRIDANYQNEFHVDHVRVGSRYNICSLGCFEAWARRLATNAHYVTNLATAAEDR